MDVRVLAYHQKLIYISSVQTQDVVWKSCQEQWMIGMDRERESEKPVLPAQLNDDYPVLINYAQ